MNFIIDKRTRDLINESNKNKQDILKLFSVVNKILDKSTSLVATGSFGQPPSTVVTSDPTAIHDNVAGEINAITEKTVIVDNDIIVGEDSENSYSKIKIKITNIVASLVAEIAALGIPFDDIANPNSDVNFVFANKHLHITFTAPTTEAGVILELLGNTSGKDLLHLHQHTGNPTGPTTLQHLEWNNANVCGMVMKNNVGGAGEKLIITIIKQTSEHTVTYPDKNLTFAVDTVAEAQAAAQALDPFVHVGDVELADNKVIKLGDSDDFIVMWNGASGILRTSTGNIVLRSSTGGVILLIGDRFRIQDDQDSDATLFDFNTNVGSGRTLAIGAAANKIALTLDGNARFNDNIGFFNTAPQAQSSAYTPTNVNTTRSFDADSTSLDEIADVLGTLILDLQTYGLIG